MILRRLWMSATSLSHLAHAHAPTEAVINVNGPPLLSVVLALRRSRQRSRVELFPSVDALLQRRIDGRIRRLAPLLGRRLGRVIDRCGRARLALGRHAEAQAVACGAHETASQREGRAESGSRKRSSMCWSAREWQKRLVDARQLARHVHRNNRAPASLRARCTIVPLSIRRSRSASAWSCTCGPR
jgi:hypothetical protein